jgi:putative phage-type endonuclease
MQENKDSDSDYVLSSTEDDTETDLEITEDDCSFETSNSVKKQLQEYNSLCCRSVIVDAEEEDDDDAIAETDSIVEMILNHNDYCDILEDIYNEFDWFIENNMLKLSSSKFESHIVEYVTDIFYTEWLEFKICEEEDYNDINEFVEQAYQSYELFLDFPRRSIPADETEAVLCQTFAEMRKNYNIITELQNLPQPSQRTKEWYEFRNGLISASNLWKVFGTESQVNSIVQEKCRSVEEIHHYVGYTEGSMHWGVKYEPVTVMIYENIYKTKLGEFGCIRHPSYPFIGASPDGINIDYSNALRYGRMVEIKNIYNREITGIPKLEYWIQTQIQMETCDLERCDFVETRFIEYVDEKAFYSDEEHLYKGVILSFTDGEQTFGKPVSPPSYKYMPLSILKEKEDIDEWIRSTQIEYKANGKYLYSVIYWYLDTISCILIERNRKWFQAALPIIKKTWDKIEYQRTQNVENTKIILTNDNFNSSYFIKNMPLSNSVCLVKLDNIT